MNVIFYDNDEENIINMTSVAKCIFIEETSVSLKYKTKENYCKNFINNTYCLYYPKCEETNPSNAFSVKHATQLLEWLKYKRHPIVIFDWDKTLTCCDGCMIENSPFTYNSVNIEIRDVIEYLCGGETRVAMLRYIFQQIRKKGEIFILTNNPVSFTNKPEFLKMIRYIDPVFKAKCLVYGNMDKKKAIMNSYKLHHLPIDPPLRFVYVEYIHMLLTGVLILLLVCTKELNVAHLLYNYLSFVLSPVYCHLL
jgi:hypothetical protein